MDRFEDRRCTQVLTTEWVEHATRHEKIEDVVEQIELAARRFERTYNAVAEVRVDEAAHGGREITVRTIAAQDADLDEINRGMEAIMH